MSRPEGPNLSQTLRSSWKTFSREYEPLRPDLYRYCRHLTRSPWDAEDLAQDALSRAFVTLGRMDGVPPNPRAWLFRVASNLWIDQMRRRRERPTPDNESVAESRDPQVQREAGGTLLARLSPQERASVALKDVFDFTLDEIAEVLTTTTGAVKAALHRGREKLAEPEPALPAVTDRAVLDAFCDAFNARDMDRLTSLLLDTVTVDVVGTHTDYGPESARKNALYGMLFGAERMAASETVPAIDPRFVRGALPVPPRCEVREHHGEALLLLWYQHTDGEAVRAINRLQTEGGRVQSLQNYFFTPDFIAEVCAALGVPFRSNGYLTGC